MSDPGAEPELAFDPLDEECARAMCEACGRDPDEATAFSKRPRWQMLVPMAQQIRAVFGVMRAHEERIDATASECAALLREVAR